MAEPLKSFFSVDLVRRIARSIEAVHPRFPTRSFVRDATRELDALELMDRARLIAEAMRRHLPERYPEAIEVLLASLGPEHRSDELEGAGMAPFFYLPHTMLVGTHGLADFEVSMRAQHALTRRFTCEFSIRPFLERHPTETLEVLRRWVDDPSAHVRRLVSEGTRPRLPWAARVSWIEREPGRVLPLIEALRDDEASAVRRSVANHLNDLAKTRPDLVCDIGERWLEGATPERRALVKHALRTLVKRGDGRALALLGHGEAVAASVVDVTLRPARVRIGGSVRVSFAVASTSPHVQSLAVDLVVHFVKARGQTSPKVFKVGTVTLEPGAIAPLGKTVSLAVHTTRKPHPGVHSVEAMINGRLHPLGVFVVAP